jgi:enoyl-CoA hydratase/carnithine racemase
MNETIRSARATGAPGVAIVTLDRPPVNAVTPICYERLDAIFTSFERQKDVNCVVLTGAGDRAFCAGADRKQLGRRTIESTLDRATLVVRAFEAIRKCPVPVIGAINGPAIGVGFMFAACCDLLVVAKEAVFAIPEIDLGVPAGVRHLNGIVPERTARLLAYTGRRVDAAFLKQQGAVAEIVSRDAVLSSAIKLAHEIALKDPLSIRLTKDAILNADKLPLEEGYRVQQLYSAIAVAISSRGKD